MNGRKKLPVYVLRDKQGRSVPWPVDPSKRERQAIERALGVSGKKARKLMKALRRQEKEARKATEPADHLTPAREASDGQ